MFSQLETSLLLAGRSKTSFICGLFVSGFGDEVFQKPNTTLEAWQRAASTKQIELLTMKNFLVSNQPAQF